MQKNKNQNQNQRNILLDTDNTISNEFELNLENLKIDIEHIDLKLQNIQKHVTVLESSITKLYNQINSSKIQNKVPYYNAYNRALETLILMQGNYQKYLDIKFKYRKEQNDLRFKVIHMLKIDLQKINAENDELTTSKLIEVLRQISSINSNESKETQQVLDHINKDPKYEL